MQICECVYVTDDQADRRVAAAHLLRALGNPHRVGIVEALASGPRCVHELVDELGLDQPLVSQHLRVLRSAHLLRSERRGKEVVYSLADDHVAHIVGDAITHAQEPT
jgi:DNA-binding transcriptional ArsR family regulator